MERMEEVESNEALNDDSVSKLIVTTRDTTSRLGPAAIFAASGAFVAGTQLISNGGRELLNADNATILSLSALGAAVVIQNIRQRITAWKGIGELDAKNQLNDLLQEHYTLAKDKYDLHAKETLDRICRKYPATTRSVSNH